MMTRTEYDPKVLSKLREEQVNGESLDTLLAEYQAEFEGTIRNKSQRLYFNNYIKGLLSSLDRKSVEPIALHMLGEKYVRPMQQLLVRSPLDDDGLMKKYREKLSTQINSAGGMLSVDESSFIKKGDQSIGVKRQYCGRLGKTENCQVGVFLAYAGEKGYGLVDRELYIPKEWYDKEHEQQREKCGLPEGKKFETKNEIAQRMLNAVLESGQFNAQWIGCDAAYGNDHAFLDGLRLPENVWYFAATNAKERVFLERPEMIWPERKKGRPAEHPSPSVAPVSVKTVAENVDIPWETVALTAGAKGTIYAKIKRIRCVACRNDGSRNYVKPGVDIWLYIREYEDGIIKYFVSNAPEDTTPEELNRAATLRWPIEQCFEECKGYLGMSHYECRSYCGWMRHMLFVMIAHLFLMSIQLSLKKRYPCDDADGCSNYKGDICVSFTACHKNRLLSYKEKSCRIHRIPEKKTS